MYRQAPVRYNPKTKKFNTEDTEGHREKREHHIFVTGVFPVFSVVSVPSVLEAFSRG
jgi:hypothetical protein